MTPDEQLVALALAGDDSAFATLVSRYQVRLLRFLLTRSASREDAEDALQDTFVNAYRYLHSYDERWRFSTWLYRIGIRNLRGWPTASEGADDLVDAGADPLQQCITQSSRENLWLMAKDVLSSEAYMALWLRYVEDMSIKEVAASMERSNAWTKVALFRARKRLQQALQAQANDSGKGEVYG